MEILILSEKASPQITSQHLKKLQDYARYFLGQFEQIHVLSSFDMDQLAQFDFPPGVVFHNMPLWKPSSGFRQGYLHFKYLLRLFYAGHKLLADNPNIMAITQNFSHYVVGVVVLLLAHVHNRKTVIRVAGDPEVGKYILRQRFGVIGKFLGSILPFTERIVVKRADLIFSSSKLLLEKYPQLSTKTTILPDPVPILDILCGGNVTREKRNRREGDPLEAIFVGRLEPEKGLSILITALAETPLVHCKIVGSGSLASIMEKLIRDLNLSARVSLLGQKSNMEVIELIASSDVLVLPSFTEYTPAVLLEAAALEIPVIASRVGGVKYLIEDQVTGLLFDPGNVQSLVSTLVYFQDSEDRWAEWGKKAKEFACETFSSRVLMQNSGLALRALKHMIDV